MSKMTHTFRIGTRASKLALWQANYVADLICQMSPEAKNISIELVKVRTQGDKIRDVALHKMDSKGIFTKELDRALLAGELDCCVHSMKDVPSELACGLEIVAMPSRADVRDALVARNAMTLATLPAASKLGCGSLRRKAQIRALRDDLDLCDVRGNLDTRLRKLEKGELDAMVVACAGVDRLGCSERIVERIDTDLVLPCAGQGAIGVTINSANAFARKLIAPIADRQTMLCVEAERAVMRNLKGGCHAPMGVWARIENGRFILDAMVACLDGSKLLRAKSDALPEQGDKAAHEASADLFSQGAQEILDQIQT